MTQLERKENFRRIASKRVNQIITEIESLANLKNLSFYYAEPKDYAKIIKALRESIDSLETQFTKKKRGKFIL